MTTEVHVATIEWDSSENPSVILGTSWRIVAERAASELQASRYASDDPDFFDDEEYSAARNKPAATMTDDELATFLDDFHEATTVPWAEISTQTIHTD